MEFDAFTWLPYPAAVRPLGTWAANATWDQLFQDRFADFHGTVRKQKATGCELVTDAARIKSFPAALLVQPLRRASLLDSPEITLLQVLNAATDLDDAPLVFFTTPEQVGRQRRD